MTPTTLKRLIKSQMALYDYNSDNMAIRMHMSRRAWNRRLQYPEKISTGELCQLDKILKMGLFTEEAV